MYSKAGVPSKVPGCRMAKALLWSDLILSERLHSNEHDDTAVVVLVWVSIRATVRVGTGYGVGESTLFFWAPP